MKIDKIRTGQLGKKGRVTLEATFTNNAESHLVKKEIQD